MTTCFEKSFKFLKPLFNLILRLIIHVYLPLQNHIVTRSETSISEENSKAYNDLYIHLLLLPDIRKYDWFVIYYDLVKCPNPLVYPPPSPHRFFGSHMGTMRSCTVLISAYIVHRTLAKERGGGGGQVL